MFSNQVPKLERLRELHNVILEDLGTLVGFARRYRDGDKVPVFQSMPIDNQPYTLMEAILYAERGVRAFKALKIIRSTPLPAGHLDQIIAHTDALNGTVGELLSVTEGIGNWPGKATALSGSRLQDQEAGQMVADLGDVAIRTVNATDQLLAAVNGIAGLVTAHHKAGDDGQDATIMTDNTAAIIAALAETEAATVRARTLLGEIETVSAGIANTQTQMDEKFKEATELANEDLTTIKQTVSDVAETSKSVSGDAAVVTSKREEVDRLSVQAQDAYKDLSGFSATLSATRKKLSETQGKSEALAKEFEGQRAKVEEMIVRAEKMVSGSTVSGLARAFNEERAALDKSMSSAFWWFVVGIVLLFLTSGALAAYVLNVPIPGLEWLTRHGSAEPTLAGVASRAVIIIAPFWLTLFSSRRYRSLFDLRQQYSHKYNMAFSMVGFKPKLLPSRTASRLGSSRSCQLIRCSPRAESRWIPPLRQLSKGC